MLRPAAALECKLHDSSQEESVVLASLQPWTPLPKVKEEILLAGGFEWKWTYKLLPLVVMTLLVRLLLLLWLVIGRGFGKVFLRNKGWRENANGGQSTIVCWKGTWAMFLAEPPLPVCPPHPPALHTPVNIRHQTHHMKRYKLDINLCFYTFASISGTSVYSTFQVSTPVAQQLST